MSERKQVILFMTDTTRKDMLGCYGDSRMITPNLDRLARREFVMRMLILASQSAVRPEAPFLPVCSLTVTVFPRIVCLLARVSRPSDSV